MKTLAVFMGVCVSFGSVCARKFLEFVEVVVVVAIVVILFFRP